MGLEIWLAFSAASIALLLIPGPTILLVLSYALSQGKKSALACVAGVVVGDLICMTASLLGLGAILMASATLFLILKWVGAAYLIYMGVRLFMSAGKSSLFADEAKSSLSPKQIFTNVATVTLVNPKSIIFFVAFVPQFIDTNAVLLPQFSILIATFVGLATINVLAYALLANKLRSKIQRPSVMAALTRFGGSALIAMGVVTATFRRA